MSLNELIRAIDLHSNVIWAVILVLSILIEVTPIKINPWSALVSWISRLFTKDLKAQLTENTETYLASYKDLKDNINDIKKEVNAIKENNDTERAMTSRYRIIRAADELRNGASKLSEDHLEQLGEDIDIYDKYCKTHPMYRNHKGQKSKALILAYEQQLEDNKLD